MPVSRRFLIARSLTRLIGKEYGWERIREGHFPPKDERQSHIKISTTQAQLVLTSLNADPGTAENYADVPRAHAEAMFQVSTGTLTIERSVVPLPGHGALVDRFVAPGPLDLVSVEFTSEGDAADFVAPVWFGAEVSQDEGYVNRVMALSGLPSAPVVEASNAALEGLLDIIEGGATTGSLSASAREVAAEQIGPAAVVANAPVAAAVVALPRARAFSAQGENASGNVEPRRPVIQPRSGEHETADEQLASVIKGLSAALSDTPSQVVEEGEERARRSWRRTSH